MDPKYLVFGAIGGYFPLTETFTLGVVSNLHEPHPAENFSFAYVFWT